MSTGYKYPSSATIYQFPTGGRAGWNAERERAKAAAKTDSTRAAPAATSSGWYHEAAMLEADPSRKPQ